MFFSLVKRRSSSHSDRLPPSRPLPSLENLRTQLQRLASPLLSADELTEFEAEIEGLVADPQIVASQKALESHKSRVSGNWFEPLWTEKHYLASRSSVLESSCAGLLPKDLFGEDPQEGQLQFILQMVKAAASTKGPRFTQTQLPKLNSDISQSNQNSRHIAVVDGDHVYQLTVRNANGDCLSDAHILSQLKQVFREKVRQPSVKRNPDNPIGLTAANRDKWAKVREDIGQTDSNAFFDCLESALFTVSLGDLHQNPTENVYWDGGIHLACGTSGDMAIVFNHSELNGVQVTQIINQAYSGMTAASEATDKLSSDAGESEAIKKVTYDTKVQQGAIHSANAFLIGGQEKTVKHNQSSYWFKGLGQTKQEFKVSPDMLVQLAMKLADASLKDGVQTPVYESVHLNRYVGGGIDGLWNIYPSFSSFLELWNAYKANPQTFDEYQTLSGLFNEVKANHKDQLVAAKQGLACERHLALLDKMRDPGTEKPRFYSSKHLQKCCDFSLVTTNIASQQLQGLVFHPGNETAIGVGYTIRQDELHFVSSYHHTLEANADQFEEAFITELRRLMQFLSSSYDTDGASASSSPTRPSSLTEQKSI